MREGWTPSLTFNSNYLLRPAKYKGKEKQNATVTYAPVRPILTSNYLSSKPLYSLVQNVTHHVWFIWHNQLIKHTHVINYDQSKTRNRHVFKLDHANLKMQNSCVVLLEITFLT